MRLTADLMLSRRLEPRRLVAVLARATGVDPAHVDIRHTDADQEGRDWDARVLCTYHELLGDVRMSLSVSVRLDDAAGPAAPAGPVTEAGLAARVAELAGAGVIHTDDRIDPSTWWLSDPSGVVTRVRLYEHDAPEGADEPPTLTLDAVESPVTAYPDARVTPLAEILREVRVGTPVTDGVRRALPSQALSPSLSPAPDSGAVTFLDGWERFVRRMAADWPPAGQYLPELYDEALRDRDLFEAALAAGGGPETITAAMASLDEIFRTHTVEDGGAALRAAGIRGDGPRRTRRPRLLPWPDGSDVSGTWGGGGGQPRVPLGAALRDALGEPGDVRLLDSSPRSSVWAAELPRVGPVVVKQLVQGPGAEERYAREVAGLRAAGRLHPPVTPRLLGTDPGARVLVLERVEHGAPREGWEVEYATALARLHAAAPTDTATTSTGTAPATTSTGTDPAALPRWSGPDGTDIDSFLALARWLGAPVPGQVPTELERLTRRLGRQPRRPALLHGDPCPGNDLHTADGIRFIDFEQASLGNGLNELAYLRVGFPTCWCVTAAPEPLLAAAEAAYRTTWREATGTEPEGELADACAGWLIRGDALVERARRGTADQLARLTHEDWTWGTATARQRLLHRLEVVASDTSTDTLTALGTLCADMAGRVLARWPQLRPVPARRPHPYP